MNLVDHKKMLVGASFLALIGATGAGAATIHRYAITSGTGSGGAATTLQTSASGGAFQGEVASSPNTNIKIPFGLLGEYDPSGSAFGIGVAGISTTGYGVGAESLSATQPSLLALNSAGGPAAEFSATGGGVGLSVLSDFGDIDFLEGSLTAENTSQQYGTAVAALDDSKSDGLGILGYSFSGYGVAIDGISLSGDGVIADSESNAKGAPALQLETGTPGTELLEAGAYQDEGGYSASTVLTSVSANNSGGVFTSGRSSSDLQINGDIYVTGAIYTNCRSTVPYQPGPCTDKTLVKQRGSTGTTYGMYAAKHATETVEDEGETILRGGLAHVALDPAFASVISRHQPYLVFTTPNGESKGLYVVNKTASGFDVRENGRGTSTMPFDYRIVAHPYDDDGARMAAVRPKVDDRTGMRSGSSPSLIAHEKRVAQLTKMQRNHALRSSLPKVPASLFKPASFTTR